MNKQNPDIIFSVKGGKNDALPFVDLKVYTENGKSATSVYRNETFCDAYISFTSFIPLEYKFGLLYSLFLLVFFLSFGSFKVSHGTQKTKENSL